MEKMDTRTLAGLIGVAPRTVCHWAEKGLIPAEGGHDKPWTFSVPALWCGLIVRDLLRSPRRGIGGIQRPMSYLASFLPTADWCDFITIQESGKHRMIAARVGGAEVLGSLYRRRRWTKTGICSWPFWMGCGSGEWWIDLAQLRTYARRILSGEEGLPTDDAHVGAYSNVWSAETLMMPVMG